MPRSDADSLIPYENLVRDALRDVVRRVMIRAAETGLPGDHHFYVSFRTDAEGVQVSNALRAGYPETMTIVLQHQYEGLAADEERFSVTLRFGGVPERLTVPYTAITAFVDPAVQFGLQFEVAPAKKPEPPVVATVDTLPAPAKSGDNVVTVDFTRKK